MTDDLARVRDAAARYAEAERARDDAYDALRGAVIRARNRGAKLAEIGEAAGMTKQRVSQLTRGEP